MEAQNIVLIVGVAVLLLERLFACLNRIKKSKCCGGEIELSSTPSKKSLNDSNNQDGGINTENVINSIGAMKETIGAMQEIVKRSSQIEEVESK